jgi:hypothetical protein
MLSLLRHTIIVSLLLLLLSSCSKEKYMANAIITGYDMRMCACCGGLMLTFSNDPTPLQSDFFLVVNEDVSLDINANTQFPVYIKLDYELVNLCAQEVKILRFKKL